jgi:hypothetical protein
MLRALCLTLALGLAVSACSGPKVDLKTAVQVTDLSTGWLDQGIVNGQNKIVPSASFKFKNVSNQPIPILQGNIIFRRVGEDDELGNGFLRVSGTEGLSPGASSQELTVSAQHGYTSTEPRQQMLANRLFVDARVQVFAKYGSTQWTLISEYPIERKLIAR